MENVITYLLLLSVYEGNMMFHDKYYFQFCFSSDGINEVFHFRLMSHVGTLSLGHPFLQTISLPIFTQNSNLMDNSLGINVVLGHHIATNFCTWHDSIAVMPCAKFYSKKSVYLDTNEKDWSLNQIWILWNLWNRFLAKTVSCDKWKMRY